MSGSICKIEPDTQVSVLSHIKHSATRRVLYCDKTLLLVYYTVHKTRRVAECFICDKTRTTSFEFIKQLQKRLS